MSVELSVIVPIFNESVDLWPMAEKLSLHLDNVIGNYKWQYVLVDNGSKDDTPKIVKQICETWTHSLPIVLPKPNYGEALKSGLLSALGKWAYIVNVDFWDPIFIAWGWKHRDKYDLILGSKRCDPSLNQQSRYRRTLTWGLNTLLQFAFGFVGTDTHGQKLLKLDTMIPLIEKCLMKRGQFDTEFTLRAIRKGLWIAEVPVPIIEHRTQRNWMFKKISQNFIDIFKLKAVMRNVNCKNGIRYHRWAREDMISDNVDKVQQF